MKIFGREPVVVLNTLSAALGLIVSLGITGLSAEQAGAIVAAVSAILGAIAAAMTRPIAPQAFTAVVAAGAVLVATFGYEVSQGTVGAINTLVLAVLTLLTRAQVTPSNPSAPGGPAGVQDAGPPRLLPRHHRRRQDLLGHLVPRHPAGRSRPPTAHPVLRTPPLVLAVDHLRARHLRVRVPPCRTRLGRVRGRLHTPHRVGHRLHRRRHLRRLQPRRIRRTLVPHLALRGHLVGEHGARVLGPPSTPVATERQGRMNVGEWAAVIGAAGSVLGGGGFFMARATVRATQATARAQEAVAEIQAQPQARAQDLAVLQATVRRVDEENGSLRGRMSRLESIVRAFAWTTDRWARQMHRAGIEPEPPHPLVDEYNRTGV